MVLYAGPSDPAGNTQIQGLNEDYRPDTQQDANGNVTNLNWQTGGKLLDSVTDANNVTTKFDYDLNTDLLIKSIDGEGRKDTICLRCR